ncbi:hypothetical protein ACK280_26215 [Mycobacterium sherrisii]|uniref:hypothetical protein n=1 Tax=Mycobacterium sherrisii TaxID=243061 RepID=UPI003974BF53
MPLGDCGCVRDPLLDHHRCGGDIIDVQIDAAAAALNHLATLGFPGIVDMPMCRALWRRGYRELAVEYANRRRGGDESAGAR